MSARTDSQILEFSQTVPGHYELDELERLLYLTRSLPKSATIVEIGVECGRSASIFLQCPENWGELHLIDARTYNATKGRRWLSRLLGAFQSWRLEPVPWTGPQPDGAPANFMDAYDPWPNFERPSDEEFQSSGWRPRSMGCEGMPGNMIYDLEITSEAAAERQKPEQIDLLHIDGDHERGVWDDCRLWLPKVRVGGVVVFHDYARKGADGEGDVFPQVTSAVNFYCSGRAFEVPAPYKLPDYSVGSEAVQISDVAAQTLRIRYEPIRVVNTQFAARRIA